MGRRSDAKTLFECALLGGLAAVIGALALPSGSAYFLPLIILGSAALVVGLGGLLWMLVFPEKTRTATAIDQSVTSHHQSGGITAHTVNLDRPSRQLDADWKTKLSKLPNDRPVTVIAVAGDTEALKFADEVWEFLNATGDYQMEFGGPLQNHFRGPERGQRVDRFDPTRTKVIIGSRS